jgi:hypothetical protein
MRKYRDLPAHFARVSLIQLADELNTGTASRWTETLSRITGQEPAPFACR